MFFEMLRLFGIWHAISVLRNVRVDAHYDWSELDDNPNVLILRKIFLECFIPPTPLPIPPTPLPIPPTSLPSIRKHRTQDDHRDIH